MALSFEHIWQNVKSALARKGYIYLDDTDRAIAERAYSDGLSEARIVERCLYYIQGEEFSMGC